MIVSPDILARARGCLLGQVAGDSLGGLVEFQDADEILDAHPHGVRELRDGGHWRTIAGQPTDDSELALALTRALVDRGGFEDDAVAAAYGRWYASGPFDRPEAGRPGVRLPRPSEYWPADVVELADQLVALGVRVT